MPYKEKEIEKLFYTIGEVAEMFHLNTSHIRFWEKEFDILKPKKNNKGNRLFTKEDVGNLHLIYHLVKEKGMTLKGAKQVISGKKQDAVDNLGIVKSLQNIRQLLIEIKDQL